MTAGNKKNKPGKHSGGTSAAAQDMPSFELQQVLQYFEKVARDPAAADSATLGERGGRRALIESFMRDIVGGNVGPDEISFMCGLVEAIHAAATAPSDKVSARRRPDAVLRATGLHGHAPHKHGERLWELEMDRIMSDRRGTDADMTELIEQRGLPASLEPESLLRERRRQGRRYSRK